jgi:hypothetical protein
MTAPQVIQQIEALGGTLTLKGDRIAYDIPKAARVLVDVLREHRDQVVQLLRGRQESAKRRLSRWVAAHCALTRNPAKVWGSEESLSRDYAAWCEQYEEVRCSRDLFNIILDESFPRAGRGWRGLCLAVDFMASKELGSKPMYPPPATEVLQ